MIKAEKLYFSYKGPSHYVLENVNFELHDGEYVSVLGENGSGKTTLMRLILKFIKPTSGSITTNAKRIGYVPQKNDFSNSDFPITVYEALNSYRKILKIKKPDCIEQVLKDVNMSASSDKLMGQLSGGQHQKILIARALIGKPDLLILDEPSTGVDIGSRKEIYSILKRVNQEEGMTVLSVEHNLEAAISNSTLIYHLVNGKGHLCSPNRYAEEFLKKEGEK